MPENSAMSLFWITKKRILPRLSAQGLDRLRANFLLPRKRRVAMKKPYQIEAQRAVRQLEEMAADGNPAVQMVLPMGRDGGLAAPGRGCVDTPGGLAGDGAVDGRRRTGTGR